MKNIIFKKGLKCEQIPRLSVGDTVLTNHSEELSEGENSREDLEKLVVNVNDDTVELSDVETLERQKDMPDYSKSINVEKYSFDDYSPGKGWFKKILEVKNIIMSESPNQYESIMNLYRRKY